MKNSLLCPCIKPLRLLLAVTLFLIISWSTQAQTTTWTGLGNDQIWANPANWTTSGGSTPPGPSDNVIFPDGAFPTSVDGYDAIVTNSTSIGSLSYLNVSPNTHTTHIDDGQTLTVNGNFQEGVASSTSVVTMSGNGNFTVNNPTGTFSVGGLGGSTETVTLSLDDGANTVTVKTFSLGESASNNGRTCTLNLGNGPTIFNADAVQFGTGKASGTIQWPAASTNGSLVIRDHSGTGRATLLMGNGTSGSGSSHGNLLAAGHPFDALVGQAVLSGDSGSDSGTGCSANLVFDDGILDVTSIVMARSSSSRAAHATGLLAVGGSTNAATLIVNGPSGPGNGSFLISDSTSAAASTGTLSVSNNGVAQIYASILKIRAATNAATINVIGGTLDMESETNTIGSQAIPIDTMNLDNANLVLYEDGSSLNASVLTLSLAETNVFTIKTLPIVSSLPTVIPLITFTSAGSLDGNPSNLVLNPLPGSYTGYLSNDNVGSISLVITNGVITSKPVTWVGSATNAWDTTSVNWKNGANLTTYQEGDFVTFDDSGTTNLINLVSDHFPATLTVNNSAANYIFTGVGAIKGPNSLVKQGTGSLTLSESGGDKFPLGVFVHGGALILDNPNSAITGGLTNDSGTVVQIGNNDGNGVLPGGYIDINGGLVFNQASNRTVATVINGSGTLTQNGSNVLTLTGANTYTGNTFVKSGTLALGGSGSIVSPLVAVQNGTLDLTPASSVFLSAVSLTNGTLNVGSGANFPALGALSLSNATINLVANYNNVGGSAILSGGALTTGGTTNILNITSIQNLPVAPTVPFEIPLISYSSFSGGFNIGWSNLPGLSGYITNNTTSSTIDLVITNAPQNLTWNGGSSTDSNWSDPANWSGVGIVPLDLLTFDGLLRTNNNNDTPAGTTYIGINFNNSAGDAPFTLNGNPVNVTGTIVDNAATVQTINLGLLVSSGLTNDGGFANGSLVIAGGVTNISTSGQTVTLLDNGAINDLWSTNNGTNGGGQLSFQVGNGSSGGIWTIRDGTGTNGLVQAGNVQLTVNSGSGGGTLNFGDTNTAPNLDAGYPSNGVVTITGSAGTFNMNNGTLKANAVAIGNSGTVNAFFNMNGGTMILGPGSFTAAGGNGATVFVGTITNGSIYSTNGGSVILAQRASGTMTMTGGLLDCNTLNLTSGTAATGDGTFTLSGGRLICTNISVGSSAGNGEGTFNFNGGVLQPAAATTALFKQNNLVPLTNNIQAGGAIFDTAGFDVTANWPLTTDPNLAGGGLPDGGLTKIGNGTLTLSMPNTYNGPTLVGGGTLLVDSIQGPSLVIVSNNATFGGNGVIGSNVTVNAGGTLAPGDNAVGELTVAGDVRLGGTTTMEIDKVGNVNDMLISTNVTPSTITYGGTLNLPTIAGSITGGETFKLFSASNYVGSFSAITPATPGAGMSWNTNNLDVDGTVSVTGTASGPTTNATITRVTFSGGNLLIHGTNNNVPNTSFHYVVLTSTNLATPLTNWTPVATNSFNSDGTFDFNSPVAPGVAHQFIDIKAVP